jgi:hypothetical protein
VQRRLVVSQRGVVMFRLALGTGEVRDCRRILTVDRTRTAHRILNTDERAAYAQTRDEHAIYQRANVLSQYSHLIRAFTTTAKNQTFFVFEVSQIGASVQSARY